MGTKMFQTTNQSNSEPTGDADIPHISPGTEKT